MAAGIVIALVVAVFAGSLLANQAVRRIEYTLDRMREFTADAAHELRGPLMAIMNNVEELSSRREARQRSVPAPYSANARRS